MRIDCHDFYRTELVDSGSAEFDFIPFGALFDETAWPNGYGVLRNYGMSLYGRSLIASPKYDEVVFSLPKSIDAMCIPASMVPIVEGRVGLVFDSYLPLFNEIFTAYRFRISDDYTIAEINLRLCEYERQKDAMRQMTLSQKVFMAFGIYPFL